MLCVTTMYDHASEMQRVQLVSEITYNALTLVQGPYGNYVSFFCSQSVNHDII
jgi:hypothetical protein